MLRTLALSLAMATSLLAAGVSADVPVPAWAAGLGMSDLEDDIAQRADDAAARGLISTGRASELKSQMGAIKDDERARRAARDFPESEFNRSMGRLQAIAAQLPDIPLLHPVQTAPTGDWSQAQASAPLDLSGYHLTFHDDFDRLDISGPQGGASRWFAPVHADFGEARFLPAGPGGPFSIEKTGVLGFGGSALAIHARRTPQGWTGGLIQTVDGRGRGFAQQYGYFEMRAKLPAGAATWPAFWLLTRNGFTDPSLTRGEIDVLEQYGSAPDKIHSSVHLWPASGRYAGGLQNHWYKSEKLWVGDMSSAYHRYGVMLTPDWVITYYDGAELSRFPAPPQYRTPVYMLVDLTMHQKDLAHAHSPSTLLVDYVRAYAKDG